MKTQKIIFSAVLVFAAGLLLFAKSSAVIHKGKSITATTTLEKNNFSKATLKVVWHDEYGMKKEAAHKALSTMPYAQKDEYYYDFENQRVVKKLYASVTIKKVWNHQND